MIYDFVLNLVFSFLVLCFMFSELNLRFFLLLPVHYKTLICDLKSPNGSEKPIYPQEETRL
jgi:hypothetical protein